MLKLNGYSTALFGKCHKVPVSETSPAGPFDHWPHPSGGFEYFYGLVGGETTSGIRRWYENTHGPIRGCDHRTVPADRPTKLIESPLFRCAVHTYTNHDTATTADTAICAAPCQPAGYKAPFSGGR